MTRHPAPLPPHIRSSAFTVSAGLRAGLSRRATQNRRFVSPHFGVRRIKTSIPEHEFDREKAQRLALEYQPLLRTGEAFSHTTALLLLKVPVNTHPEIHVTARVPMGQARGRNVKGHRTRKPFAAVISEEGLPCVPYLTALIQSEPLLSFRELVVALDHLTLLRGRAGSKWSYVSRNTITKYLRKQPVRGVARLRAALEVSRLGAESRMESLQHFELARAGVDTFEMQAEIDSSTGERIGRFDMADRVRKRIVEYDGEQHRTSRSQYLHDDARLDLVRDEGWKVKRFHKEDYEDTALEATRKKLCEFLGVSPKPVAEHLVKYFAEPLSVPRPMTPCPPSGVNAVQP